jgi:hypothetical protein
VLLSLYRQTAFAKISATSPESIKAAQQRVAASAKALRVPLCAPVPLSAS